MAREIYASSVEPIDVAVRCKDPINGELDITGQAVAIALPVAGAAPSTWVTASWKAGRITRGVDRFYVATVSSSGFTLAGGTTYQAWVRVGGVGGAMAKAETIRAIAS